MDEDIDKKFANEVSLVDLKEAIMCALSADGTLGKLKAQLRAAAVGILRNKPALGEAAVGKTVAIGALSLETQVAFLLIHEFLLAHSMNVSAGLFEEECTLSEVSEEALNMTQTLCSGSSDSLGKKIPTPPGDKKNGRTDSLGDALPSTNHEVLAIPCLTLLVKNALQRGDKLDEMDAEGGPDLNNHVMVNNRWKNDHESLMEHSTSLSGSGKILPPSKSDQKDTAQAVSVDLDHEAQLRELENASTVVQALRELEDSFTFSDTECRPNMDELTECKVVQDW